jgi:hypothetical protein
MRHVHENFQGESLVGVYCHSVRELHSSKYPYENPTLGELDHRVDVLPQASS